MADTERLQGNGRPKMDIRQYEPGCAWIWVHNRSRNGENADITLVRHTLPAGWSESLSLVPAEFWRVIRPLNTAMIFWAMDTGTCPGRMRPETAFTMLRCCGRRGKEKSLDFRYLLVRRIIDVY